MFFWKHIRHTSQGVSDEKNYLAAKISCKSPNKLRIGDGV